MTYLDAVTKERDELKESLRVLNLKAMEQVNRLKGERDTACQVNSILQVQLEEEMTEHRRLSRINHANADLLAEEIHKNQVLEMRLNGVAAQLMDMRKALEHLREPCTRADFTIGDLDREVIRIASEALAIPPSASEERVRRMCGLLREVESHFAGGSDDDGMDLWRRISDALRAMDGEAP